VTNRLRLPWEKHESGYEIVHFKPSAVDWNDMDQVEGKVYPHGRLPPPMPILPDGYGGAVQDSEDDHLAHLKVISPIGNKIENFDPIEKAPDLYLTFANTPRSVDSILKFAKEYGLLKSDEGHETVDVWRYHILLMNQAISKWEHVQKDRPAAFANIYKSLSPYSENNLKHSLQEEGSTGALMQFFEPVNLLAAMWVQFAGAIEGATSFGPCQECSAWINTDPRSNRPDKIYCSTACRMRAYRKRNSRKEKR
jgi:hypothetical protein